MKSSRMLWLVSYKLENGTLITYENVLQLNDFLLFTDKRCNAESLNAFISKSRFRAKSNIRQYGMSATIYMFVLSYKIYDITFVKWRYP